MTILIVGSETLKFKDATGCFLALLSKETSAIIKDRLQIVLSILNHLDDESFEPCISKEHGYAFHSMHLDTYNRFAENVGDQYV